MKSVLLVLVVSLLIVTSCKKSDDDIIYTKEDHAHFETIASITIPGEWVLLKSLLTTRLPKSYSW